MVVVLLCIFQKIQHKALALQQFGEHQPAFLLSFKFVACSYHLPNLAALYSFNKTRHVFLLGNYNRQVLFQEMD